MPPSIVKEPTMHWLCTRHDEDTNTQSITAPEGDKLTSLFIKPPVRKQYTANSTCPLTGRLQPRASLQTQVALVLTSNQFSESGAAFVRGLSYISLKLVILV